MSSNIDDLKKKIIYRSSYRGTKEMEILLSSFVKDSMHKLDELELKNLLYLLNFDDDNLYKFKQGLKTDIKIEDNKIFNMFKEYVLKK